VITHYSATGLRRPFGIAAGSDGALWFTNGGDPGSIGRITTAGVVTFFTDPRISEPDWITAGPDGALWFTNGAGGGFTFASIERITTSGTLTTFTAPSISEPAGIATGPDGALWFVNSAYPGTNAGSIGRITTSGAVTEYTYAGSYQPHGITAGPGNSMWFTNGNPNSIERITMGGAVTDYTSPDFGALGGSYVGGGGGITYGGDGALWFTDYGGIPEPAGGVVVGRATPDGVFTVYINPSSNVGANEITAGPNDTVWFTMGTAGIGRLSAPTLTVVTAPALSGPAQAGMAESVSTGTWSPSATSYSYQWYLGSSKISGATAATYVPPAADSGMQLRCVVTAHRADYVNGSYVTSPVTLS
jgi:virginiamycin B lyase